MSEKITFEIFFASEAPVNPKELNNLSPICEIARLTVPIPHPSSFKIRVLSGRRIFVVY